MSRSILPVVRPLTPLYRAVWAARNLAYDRGWARARRLRNPVICVGNISVGGSGKTPLTIRLAELLVARGIGVDVLSRGYGRRSAVVARVDPAGAAEDFGDEPLLIAQSAQVPVYVGASRYAAGALAESDFAGPRVHLLDDGFQHRQLARDVDIVVLHRDDLKSGLLPAGRLREPLSALGRAHFLALREEDADLEQEMRGRGLRQPVLWMRRRVEIPKAGRAVAFCAIGHPEEFFRDLKDGGMAMVATRWWRDHHRYTLGGAAELVELLRQHHADAFVTTAKDFARLDVGTRTALENAAPVHVARLGLTLRDEPMVIDQLMGSLPGAGDRPGRMRK